MIDSARLQDRSFFINQARQVVNWLSPKYKEWFHQDLTMSGYWKVQSEDEARDQIDFYLYRSGTEKGLNYLYVLQRYTDFIDHRFWNIDEFEVERAVFTIDLAYILYCTDFEFLYLERQNREFGQRLSTLLSDHQISGEFLKDLIKNGEYQFDLDCTRKAICRVIEERYLDYLDEYIPFFERW